MVTLAGLVAASLGGFVVRGDRDELVSEQPLK